MFSAPENAFPHPSLLPDAKIVYKRCILLLRLQSTILCSQALCQHAVDQTRLEVVNGQM